MTSFHVRPRLRPVAVAAVLVAAGALALSLALGGEVALFGRPASLAASGGGSPVGTAPSGTATTRGLTPGMRAAYEAARRAMLRDGIRMALTSGYRSPAEQQQLYDEAIAKYGSPEAARRWVLPPEESEHVRGLAVDIRPREAAAWIDAHGARFGLCRTMTWEWWHVEYRDAWRASGHCPPMRQRQ